jgi:hypothetical protein
LLLSPPSAGRDRSRLRNQHQQAEPPVATGWARAGRIGAQDEPLPPVPLSGLVRLLSWAATVRPSSCQNGSRERACPGICALHLQRLATGAQHYFLVAMSSFPYQGHELARTAVVYQVAALVPATTIRRGEFGTLYRGDKYEFCNNKKCRKKTKWLKCPRCNGRGNTQYSRCGNNCNEGYKCENGVSDQWH